MLHFRASSSLDALGRFFGSPLSVGVPLRLGGLRQGLVVEKNDGGGAAKDGLFALSLDLPATSSLPFPGRIDVRRLPSPDIWTAMPAMPSSFGLTVDHVVVFSRRKPEETEQLYGELGLSCALRKRVPERFAEMAFFRVGDLLLEVVHPFRKESSSTTLHALPSDPPAPAPAESIDRLFGVAFRCPSIDRIRNEIGPEFAIMETRNAIQAETQVASVHKPPLGIPILLVEKKK
jgi:hypothetical protein